MADDLEEILRQIPKVFSAQKFTGSQTETAAAMTTHGSFEDAVFVGCHFENYVHEGVMLYGATFVGCTFKNVDFYWGSMYKTRFIKCELDNVIFCGAYMPEAVFVACRLSRCDFSKDNLGGDTELSAVVFHDTVQEDCIYTRDGPKM